MHHYKHLFHILGIEWHILTKCFKKEAKSVHLFGKSLSNFNIVFNKTNQCIGDED